MIYLEMSRDETHGGGAWAFPNCVWAPAKRRDGGAWPFWSKIHQIKDGDAIIHLRGVPPNANFVGYSTAAGKGFETEDRPPEPGEWDFAERYYRADLTSFVPFHQNVNLKDVFEARKLELVEYFEQNKTRGARKAKIFYVRQSGRLQCLNGAYLSDIDDELLPILFDHEGTIAHPSGRARIVSVETGSQIATVQARRGQDKFSEEIKRLYSNKCCFPGCSVTDHRFLVGSHIARWSDNEELRGNLGNGLCFCLLHDKAFEEGLFTLDDQLQVFVNPRERSAEASFLLELFSHHGNEITLAEIRPLRIALLEHRNRVGIDPYLGASE